MKAQQSILTSTLLSVFMRLIYVITSLGPLMYTSKAAAAHFMYASLAWFGHLMSSSHIFLLIPHKPKKQGIAGTAGGKRGGGGGRMVAGSDMNENIQQTGEDIICTRHTLDQL